MLAVRIHTMIGVSKIDGIGTGRNSPPVTVYISNVDPRPPFVLAPCSVLARPK